MAVGSVRLAVGLCATSGGAACIAGGALGVLGVETGRNQIQQGGQQLFGTYRSDFGRRVLHSLGRPIEYEAPLVSDAKNLAMWSLESLLARKLNGVPNTHQPPRTAHPAQSRPPEAASASVTPPSQFSPAANVPTPQFSPQPVNRANATTDAAASTRVQTILEVFRNAQLTTGKPNQFETILEDGTQVLFRRDFGENAHGLNVDLLRGRGRIDHYNVEIHIPKQSIRGGNKRIENLHIIPNGNNEYYWFLENKRVNHESLYNRNP